MNHQIPKTQTIIEAVRTRLEHLKNNAFKFFGISLRYDWDTESCNHSSLVEQPDGQQLRTEVRVFSDSAMCAGNKKAYPNQTWATRLSELWESSTFMDKYDITGRPVQFHLHKFSGHTVIQIKREIQTFLGSRSRVVSEDEPYSCQCSTILNRGNQAMSRHVSKPKNPNIQSKSSKVIGVSVDLDKKECGTVQARINQRETWDRQENDSEVGRNFTSNILLC